MCFSVCQLERLARKALVERPRVQNSHRTIPGPRQIDSAPLFCLRYHNIQDVLHMVPTLWCPEHTNFLPDTIRSLFIHNIVYGSLPDTIPFPLILTNIITPSFSLSLMNYQL